jgi:uncharacterized damage-inducible protein DinB
MNPTIQELLDDWKNIRGRTLKFLDSVPQEKWQWKPHELLGTFGMQVRHLGKSQEAYIRGLKAGKVEFTDKTFNPVFEKDKQKALSHLKKLDDELFAFLSSADPEKEIIFVDGVTGEHNVPLKIIISWLIDHEYYHQGIFTCYGRLAGLGKFIFM